MSEQRKPAWKQWQEEYMFGGRKTVAGLIQRAFDNLGGNRRVKDMVDGAAEKLVE